ncbi:MAG: TolB-like translocation protein [Planctomycetota bacterium]
MNWGKTDRYLYTNDVINNEGVCVRIDLETKEAKAFAGPMYHLASDESAVIGFPLDLINATQSGYGVPLDADKSPRKYTGAPGNEGLWMTDLKSNKKKLLVSLKDIKDSIPASEKSYFKEGTFYFFHSKFNEQKTRIMLVVRCLFFDEEGKWDWDKRGGWNPQLFTFNIDGSNIRRAVPRELWALGGNHPNWHPDGEHIVMNLTPDGKTRRFCQFKYDGSDFKILSKTHRGSGHMRVDAGSNYLIADAYQKEPFTNEKDEVPIRLLNLRTDEEQTVCMIYTGGEEVAFNVFRIDPHVVWDRNYKKVCFNGCLGGRRQVFIADLSEVI